MAAFNNEVQDEEVVYFDFYTGSSPISVKQRITTGLIIGQLSRSAIYGTLIAGLLVFG